VGGPTEGHLHLGGSNVDWGQDLWYVKAWYVKHPHARPLYLGYDLELVNPQLVDVEYEVIPPGPVMNREAASNTPNWRWGETHSLNELDSIENRQKTCVGPLPGWYIISLNLIHRPEGDYEYFQEFEPVDRIGYSMNVYHITRDDADRLRRKLGTPLTCPSRKPEPVVPEK